LILYCLDTFATIPEGEQPELCAEAVVDRKQHWLSNHEGKANADLLEQSLKTFISENPYLIRYLIDSKLDIYLFVDGSHKYEDVLDDLYCLQHMSMDVKKIFVHDYGDPFWTGVTQAVDYFCSITMYRIVNRCNSLVTLEKVNPYV
jgi:hypothetical protein